MKEQRVFYKKDLQRILGLSETTIWRMERRGEFPKRFRITNLLVGWLAEDVNDWLERRSTMTDHVHSNFDKPVLV